MITTALVKARMPKVKQYLPDVNKNYVWGGVLIVAIAAGLYWWGKKNASIETIPIPDDTIDPNKPLTSSEIAEINSISVGLHSSIDKPWYNPTYDLPPIEKLTQSSDRVFVGVYNHYNKNFASAPTTLRGRLNTAYTWTPNIPILFDTDYTTGLFLNLFERFNRLGLQ